MTYTGSTVSSWADQSGNNNTATSLTGFEPSYVSAAINSLPAIRFVAAGTTMKIVDSTSLQPNTMSIFAVFKRQAGSVADAKIIVRPYDTAETWGAPIMAWGLAARNAGTDNLVFHINTAATLSSSDTTATFNDNTLYVAATVFDSANKTFFMNGAAAAVNNGAAAGNIDNSQTGQSIWLGSSPGGEYFDGDLAELIIYGAALSTDERKRIEAYLNARYAIYQ